MRTIFFIQILTFILAHQAVQAFPWYSFHEKKLKGISVDNQASYFLRSKKWLVNPRVDLKYKNLMVDIDLGYRYSFPEKKHKFRLSELALTLPFLISDDWVFSLGIKKHTWSHLEQYWNMGLWQPRYLIDPFRPIQMGMPGLYFQYNGMVSLKLYASYLSLPDISNYPDIENGKLKSSDPFLKDAGFFSTVLDVDSLPSIRLSDFLKLSAGFNLLHELPYSAFSLSYAYKPMNKPQYFVFTDQLNLSSQIDFTKVIRKLEYSIDHHHLLSLEARVFPMRGMSIYGAMFYERPEKTQRAAGWIYDRIESRFTTSFLLNYMTHESDTHTTSLSLSYVKVFEGKLDSDLKDAFTDEIRFVFGNAPDWKHATSLDLSYKNQVILQGYEFRLRLNHALDNKMYMLSFANELTMLRYFQVYLSGDMFFRLSPKVIQQNSSAVLRFKNLSRFMLGVRYVF